MRTDFVLGTALNIEYTVFYDILTTTLWGRLSYYIHAPDNNKIKNKQQWKRKHKHKGVSTACSTSHFISI